VYALKKLLRRTGITLLAVIVLINIAILVSGKTYLYSVLRHTVFKGELSPDITDIGIFPMHTISKSAPQPWPVSTRLKTGLPAEFTSYFEAYGTTSYLVIQHDSILFEKYWEGFDEKSVTNSFSMAKTINSVLIGIALREGLIKSVDQPVKDFLPEFAEGAKSHITIRHLLTMSSGLDFNENYISPLAWPAEAYYGDDVNALTLKADPETEPGKVWYYKGGDSQLLGMILQKAVHGNVSDYAASRLWNRIGAESDAHWSLDRENGMEKVSCCFYATARDFARIPKLYLSNGNWEGEQLVDSSFVQESLEPADLTDRTGAKNKLYGYQWWLTNHDGMKVFYMRGIRGQYVFCMPQLDLIIVRTGHRRAAKNGDDLPLTDQAYLAAAVEMARH
jgi:CubicO group peptidase (beta-lactamase class C family)